MVLFQFYISATLPRYDEVGNDYDYANQHAYQPIEEGNAALSKKTKLLHIHLQRILLIPYKLHAGTLDAETGTA